MTLSAAEARPGSKIFKNSADQFTTDRIGKKGNDATHFPKGTT